MLGLSVATLISRIVSSSSASRLFISVQTKKDIPRLKFKCFTVKHGMFASFYLLWSLVELMNTTDPISRFSVLPSSTREIHRDRMDNITITNGVALSIEF